MYLIVILFPIFLSPPPCFLKIKRILIGHDNVGLRAGWHLASVEIIIPVHGKMYNFPCNRWLDKTEADGKVEIEVYPSEIMTIEKCKGNVLFFE